MGNTVSPAAAMAIVYWLHMLATVIWIGGLVALVVFVIPSAQRVLNPEAFAGLLAAIQRRLDPFGWFCLALLVGTGMFQMSANPNYGGFLAIDSTWAAAILIKHAVFLLMIVVSGYLTWGVLPNLQRAILKLNQGKPAPEMVKLQRQNILLVRINLALAVFVLLLTALARVS